MANLESSKGGIENQTVVILLFIFPLLNESLQMKGGMSYGPTCIRSSLLENKIRLFDLMSSTFQSRFLENDL